MKIFYTFIILLSFSHLFADECSYSKWGKGDEIGNANLITAESVLKASKLITEGKTYSLGITIDKDTPAPEIAINYWGLDKNATLREVIEVIRDDEAGHRDRNHAIADSI